MKRLLTVSLFALAATSCRSSDKEEASKHHEAQPVAAVPPVQTPAPVAATKAPEAPKEQGFDQFADLRKKFKAKELTLAPNEKLITILGTNDIHGAVKVMPDFSKGGQLGGMPVYAGVVNSIRSGLKDKYGNRAHVLLLDGGDQFQGTLLSNISEGKLMYRLMQMVGFDGVVPGNHAFDFGPRGWSEDKVTESTKDKDPRGALVEAMTQSKMELLAANVYTKASIQNASGKNVAVDGILCKPTNASDSIDWTKAKRFPLFKPYTIKNVMGLRVAIIGIENMKTPQTTSEWNVSDLCFADSTATIKAVRKELTGKADVFLVTTHEGNINKDNVISDVAKDLVDEKGQPLVDAIVAGHTHTINYEVVNQIPIIQSGTKLTMFGRIDLVWDETKKTLVREKTRHYAGLELRPEKCSEFANFCEKKGETVYYEGKAFAVDQKVEAAVTEEEKKIASMVSRKLGQSEAKLGTGRQDENELGNTFVDYMRELSKTDFAMINNGGLRKPLEKGPFTYEQLFEISPFNNRLVIIEKVPTTKIIEIVESTIKSCGAYGTLNMANMRVVFKRDCKVRVKDGLDSQAQLVSVATNSGEKLFENGQVVNPGKLWSIGTLDFIATGGSGYKTFKELAVSKDMGIFRELLADLLEKRQPTFKAGLDGRFKEMAP